MLEVPLCLVNSKKLNKVPGVVVNFNELLVFSDKNQSDLNPLMDLKFKDVMRLVKLVRVSSSGK